VEDRTGFQAKFDGVPDAVQSKVMDVLRLSPNHGSNAAALRLEAIEKSLAPAGVGIAETRIRIFIYPSSAYRPWTVTLVLLGRCMEADNTLSLASITRRCPSHTIAVGGSVAKQFR
jgi:hypothetical protein